MSFDSRHLFESQFEHTGLKVLQDIDRKVKNVTTIPGLLPLPLSQWSTLHSIHSIRNFATSNSH